MNQSQCMVLIARLAAAWPSFELTEQTAIVWGEHLEPLDWETGLSATRFVEGECKFWPSIAEWMAAYRIAARADRYDIPHRSLEVTTAPLAGHDSPAKTEALAAMRGFLAQARLRSRDLAGRAAGRTPEATKETAK